MTGVAARQACHDEEVSEMTSTEAESWEFTRRERAYLIDAVMVLMHQMKQSKTNDLSELPELQELLERLMNGERPAPG